MMRSGKHLLFIIIIHLTISQLGLGQDSLRWDLLQAVYAGDSLRCDTLLRNGANPNACTPDSVTALMYATDGCRPDIATILLRYGADPELGSRWQQPPLISAVIQGSFALVELLLAAGADPSIQDPEGKSGLMHAGLRNDVLLTLILLDAGANTNQTDPEGRTALHAAASSGAYEAFYALLDHGASPQIADIKGITPLMITAFRGDLAISDLLIRYQAETGQKDHKGMDAASYAVSQGHYGTVAYLLDSIRTDAAWRPAALLALQTGQRKLYQEISRKSGARVNKPVGFAWDISTGMYWNGLDHFAFSEGSWIEVRTNLALGLAWMQRLGPVRVLDRSHEPWMQYRENRGAFIAGIGKPLNISIRRSMRFEVLPRFSAGLSYANRRGAVTSPKHIVLAISEVRAGLRYRKAGIHAGLAWINLRQEGISPWYFNAGISFRLSRINYKKLSLSI